MAVERTSRRHRSALMGLVIVLAGCALSAPASASAKDPARDDPRMRGVAVAAERALVTGISFGRCPSDTGLPAPIECGRVPVPIDYAAPDGQRISLMVSRMRAVGRPEERQGALLFNPGGPGASGLPFPLLGEPDSHSPARKAWSPAARAYDFVGFDPRGVGHSARISCLDPAVHHKAPTPDPRTPDDTVKRNQQAMARSTAVGCAQRNRDLLAHMTTADLARDLEVIRAALGEPRLNFFGASYGTYLGAVYATLFPSHVRRMVADSAVNPDPRGIWYGANLTQDVAFETRWADWKAWAARHDAFYGLGRTPDAVQASFDKAAGLLAAHPVGNIVGAGELHGRAVQAAYYDQEWVPFAYQLSRYLRGDSAPLVDAAAPDPGQAAGAENGEAVYLAVQCGDSPWPRDWKVWERDNSRLAGSHPFETWANAWMNLPCAYWQIPAAAPVDVRATPDSGAPPALIVQGERDAATPYAGAVELHRRLPGSRLVTEAGSGSHGLTSIWNSCVRSRIDRYLVQGVLDAEDTRCPGHPAPQPYGPGGIADANAGRYY